MGLRTPLESNQAWLYDIFEIGTEVSAVGMLPFPFRYIVIRPSLGRAKVMQAFSFAEV